MCKNLFHHFADTFHFYICQIIGFVGFTRGAVLTGQPGKKAEDKYLGYEESQKLLKAIHALENKSLIHLFNFTWTNIGNALCRNDGLDERRL